MKYKGTKISGSSILTILGVVCFATVLVAAAVLTSGMVNFAPTTVNGSFTMTAGTDPGAVNVGAPAAYPFSAVVSQAMTDTVLTVQIAKTGIVASDITSITLTYKSVTQTLTPVGSPPANTLQWTYTVGAQAAETAAIVVTVTYATAGTFTVGAQLAGTV